MNKLYNLFPQIKRARGYRLYDYKGNRYLDLYQNFGHSILGHNTRHISTIMKNVISCGLICDIPSIYCHRLKKELKKTFRHYESFFIFNSKEQAIAAISEHTGFSLKKISDPVYGDINNAAYYRPFLPEKLKKRLLLNANFLVPIFPFNVGGGPIVVCSKDIIKNIPQYPISPLLLAGLLKSIYNLKKAVLPEWHRNFKLDKKNWDILCPYIIPKLKPEKYKKVFQYSINNGIILSPDYNKPSIIPLEASKGEIKKMLEILNINMDKIWNS